MEPDHYCLVPCGLAKRSSSWYQKAHGFPQKATLKILKAPDPSIIRIVISLRTSRDRVYLRLSSVPVICVLEDSHGSGLPKDYLRDLKPEVDPVYNWHEGHTPCFSMTVGRTRGTTCLNRHPCAISFKPMVASCCMRSCTGLQWVCNS